MELSRLDKYKIKYKDFKTKINSLENFLSQYQGKKGLSVFSLDLVSQKLDIPATEAYFLLNLAEQEDLLNKKYRIKTIDDEFDLGQFDDKNEIPLKIYSDALGKYVNHDKYYIDIVFEVK
jgi:hypothetical protein